MDHMCTCIYLIASLNKIIISYKKNVRRKKTISPHFLNISVAKTYSESRALCASNVHLYQMTNEIIMEHLFISSTEMENQNSLE